MVPPMSSQNMSVVFLDDEIEYCLDALRAEFLFLGEDDLL